MEPAWNQDNNNNNDNKIPFQIKFKYVIYCGDGSALPGIEHRVTRRGESEKNIQRKVGLGQNCIFIR